MFKKSLQLLLLSLVLLLITSCYPVGTFQGPEVLPVGVETMGAGLTWMTNITSFEDSSSGKEQAFLADGSIMFRRGFAHNTEIGFKFIGKPTAILADVKWQVIQKPIMVSVDFGVSYWGRSDYISSVGYHPALIAGNELLFGVLQYNYVQSRFDILRTQDLVFGHHIHMQENDYIFTPLFGLHKDESAPDDVFYSLGFAFTGPVDDWWKP